MLYDLSSITELLYFSWRVAVNSLYKFFPARAEFFDNLLIRASSKFSLNDPFEATPSSDFWADLCLKLNYDRFGKTKDEIVKFISSQKPDSPWAELGISLYRDNGIISLTETKDNLLMWSHYAQQHTGMVVEFDIKHDFFTSKFVNDNDPNIGKVNRVLYRKERLNKLGDSLMEPYFHKSDEWSYEKEHRLLLCIYSADVTLIPKSSKHKFISTGYVKEEGLSEFNEALYKVDKSLYASINEVPDCMSMYKVPHEAIKSITFGCKSTPEFIETVKSKLKSNNIINVDLFNASIDNLDYRLKFEVEEV